MYALDKEICIIAKTVTKFRNEKDAVEINEREWTHWYNLRKNEFHDVIGLIIVNDIQ